ncbi:MAG: hypothetical protein J3R72DRAFT_492323 [Linnemannia gamsii]|nr:MAG: hypothetical protein J3R72DRAFT_492323 [Linnemannia gamsii]
MTVNSLNFFCFVGWRIDPVPVEIDTTKTIGDLKDAVKANQTPDFDDITAKALTLWHICVDPLELDETDDVSDVFKEAPLKKTIHIIVQRPPQVHALIPARVSTPLSGYPSDQFQPNTSLSGELSRPPFLSSSLFVMAALSSNWFISQ